MARSPQASQQQSVLSRPFPPGPPRRYPGREGAAPDSPGRPRAVKAGTTQTPARLPCARPHLPVMAESPALWPRGSGLHARLGLAAVAPAGSADPAPAAAPAPRAWAGTAGLGDSGQPPRTCAYFSYKGKEIRNSKAAERKGGETRRRRRRRRRRHRHSACSCPAAETVSPHLFVNTSQPL